MAKQLEMPELEFTPLESMTDSEKLDEILTSLREVRTALAAFQNVGPAGIFKMLMSG